MDVARCVSSRRPRHLSAMEDGPVIERCEEESDAHDNQDTPGSERVSLLPHQEPEPYLSDYQIAIPQTESTGFSFRKLWAFTGPGFLISIAFLDPGNIESDLEAGSVAKYQLLWVVLWSTVLGLLLQRLSARLGVVSGLHLAELCHRHYRRLPRLAVWIMMEVAIIGSDMQEVIGTAIALYLLSNKLIPLWAGVLITVFDTFTFLLLDKYGLRKLELLFGVLITVMAVTFGYEYIVVAPDQLEVTKGILLPWCEGCDQRALLQTIGIIGAIIMPHNLYLHSALVKTRDVDRTKPRAVREANKYFFIEAAVALFISFIINLFVLSVFAAGLNDKTNIEVRNICIAHDNMHADVFPKNSDPVEADIYTGGVFLGCQFGLAAMYIWGVGLLAAGQSSTMTGCYAGQFVMEGFLNLRWSRWRRVLFTRTVAILPTFCVAYFRELKNLSMLNDSLNALMSLQLPFAILPTIAFTSNRDIMGEFTNGLTSTFAAILASAGIVAFNMYSVVELVFVQLKDQWKYIVPLGLLSFVYFAFCTYLTIHMLVAIGASERLSHSRFVRKYILPSEPTERKISKSPINYGSFDAPPQLCESSSTSEDSAS